MKYKKTTIILFSFLTISAFVISCSESSESLEISDSLEGTSGSNSNSSSNSSSSSSSSSNCPTKTCADFATQAQAQATYNSNRTCYKNLDRDGNGKACESLK